MFAGYKRGFTIEMYIVRDLIRHICIFTDNDTSFILTDFRPEEDCANIKTFNILKMYLTCYF